MTDYKIHSSTSISELQNMIKTDLAIGWGLYGNPIISYEYDSNAHAYVHMYYQAMVKG